MRKFANQIVPLLLACLMAASSAFADETTQVRVKDISTIEGIRDNPLIGYGLVVGLRGTGDSRQTVFSTQTLANILQRMGVQVPATAIRVNNVAAVFVTANLPPFSRPGLQVDVTVSSLGDAKSLEGGMLLLTPLNAANGQTYAAAQGPLTLGGYSAGGGGNSKVVNHPTVARIPSGAIVEKALSVDLTLMSTFSFLLRDPDFATARDMALAVNQAIGRPVAHAVDSRRIEIIATKEDVPTDLLAQIQEMVVTVHSIAKVVVNERTGTVVMGKEVRLGAVSILHGNLEIEVRTQLTVSQPGPFSRLGETVVVPETTVKVQETPVRRIELKPGATVEDLVRGLQAIGATGRDIVAILQAIKEANALHAELEVI